MSNHECENGNLSESRGSGEKARRLPADLWVGIALICASALLFFLAVLGVGGGAKKPSETGGDSPRAGKPEADGRKGGEETPPAVSIERELYSVAGIEAVGHVTEWETTAKASEEERGPDDGALAERRKKTRENPDPASLHALSVLLKKKGEALLARAEGAEGKEAVEEIKGQAVRRFEEALELVESSLETSRKGRERFELHDMPDEEMDRFRFGLFIRADLHYLLAKARPGKGEERTGLLRKAESLFEEFIWDFEDYVQGYLAWIKMGLCAMERGEYATAMDRFNTVLSIPDHSDFLPAQKPVRNRLRIQAFYRSLELLVRAEKYVLALEKAFQMEREYPDCIEDGFADPVTGRKAVLEKARAMASLRNHRQAIWEAARVVIRGGATMARGLELLSAWEERAPGERFRIRMAVAEGRFHSGRFKEAVQAFQGALDGLRTREERKTFGPRGWRGLGLAYLRRGMVHEAGLAFREGERAARVFLKGRKWPEDLWKSAAECAYRALCAFRTGVLLSKEDPEGDIEPIEKLYADQRTLLMKRYGDSVWARNLSFFDGQDRLERGKFLDAVASFESVEAGSEFYEASRVGIGQAYLSAYLQKREEKKGWLARVGIEREGRDVELAPAVTGYLGEARASLEDFIKQAVASEVTEEDSKSTRNTVNALAVFYTGAVYAQEEEWDKVLMTLKKFEVLYGFRPDLVLSALFLKLQANVSKKRAREMDETLFALEAAEDVPLSRGIGSRKRFFLRRGREMAAEIHEELAGEARGKGDIELAGEYEERAAEYASAIPGPGETPGRKEPVRDRYWTSAIGIGGGAGGCFGGRFGGRRNLRIYGGSDRTETAVKKGLIWLKNHQNPDGMWSCANFMANCKEGACTGGGHGEQNDMGVTGLATLAFLGSGHTHRHGKFKNTVKLALKAMKSRQTADGCFWQKDAQFQWIYNHAIASMAFAEAFGLSNKSPLIKSPAQKGVDFLVDCQNPFLGWRYGRRPGENDTSVTGWAVSALWSARISGLEVPKECFDGAMNWFDKVTDETYKAGYTSQGDSGSRLQESMGKFQSLEGMTAIAVLGRILVFGARAGRRRDVRGGAKLLRQNLPKWDVPAGTIDMYYWYWGSQAMFQLGGKNWKTWNKSMVGALVPTQKNDGCAGGSWDPVGAWGPAGGRVYATAINTLTLQVYYRYGRLMRMR